MESRFTQIKIRRPEQHVIRWDDDSAFENNRNALHLLADTGIRLYGTPMEFASYSNRNRTFIMPYPFGIPETSNLKFDILPLKALKKNNEEIIPFHFVQGGYTEPDDSTVMFLLTPSNQHYIIYPSGTAISNTRGYFERNAFIYDTKLVFPLDHDIYRKMAGVYMDAIAARDVGKRV